MSSSRVARPVSLVPAGPGGLAHFAADIFSAIDISANSLGQRVICSTMLFVSNRLCILMIKRKRISSSDKKMFSFTSESLTESNWYCAAAASCVSNVGKGTPRFILKYQVQAVHLAILGADRLGLPGDSCPGIVAIWELYFDARSP